MSDLPPALSLTGRSALQRRFAALLAPKTDAELEAMAGEARALTLRNFGRTMTASGHKLKCSARAERVRFAPDSGHAADIP